MHFSLLILNSVDTVSKITTIYIYLCYIVNEKIVNDLKIFYFKDDRSEKEMRIDQTTNYTSSLNSWYLPTFK